VTGALVALTALVAPNRARADDAQAFDLAKSPFDNGQYTEAHARISDLLDPKLPACDAVAGVAPRCHLVSAELVERARALDAASLLALKRDTEADQRIAAILRKNPDYMPSPAVFPQEVMERFTMVRGTLAPELRAIAQQRAREAEQIRAAAQQARDADERWIADLQRLASRERLVEPNSRWVALVPFGIGQFQNGTVRLGVFFATAEALFGGASLASVVAVNSIASTANPALTQTALNDQINVATLVNRVSFALWGASTLAGIIEAQVNFVPEKVTYRDRPIPPRPKLAPIAAPLPGGAVLGVAGTF